MIAAPDCNTCLHKQGRLTCSRPVGSAWNPATSQRRSRLNVDCGVERSTQRTFGRRRRCGPEGWFWEPREILGKRGTVIIDEAARFTTAQHDTVGDSDGDDGA